MIVGKGLLGNSLVSIDRVGYVFFASGVSNSKSIHKADFIREEEMLIEYIHKFNDFIFVYFSTYSIQDPSLKHYPYIHHKLKMENLISKYAEKYLIIRTSNLIGEIGNPNTVLRFFYNSIQENKQMEIWKNAYRNILDIDHFIIMLDTVIKQNYMNEVLTLVNPIEYPVLNIVHECESFLNKRANVLLADKGTQFEYDRELSKKIFNSLSISSDSYLRNVLVKYFK